MTFRAASPLNGLLLGLALLAVGSVVGCQRQSEGQRCSLLNGDNDCSGDLLCTPAGQLRQGASDQVDRCCPAAGVSITDSRCTPRIGGGTGGSGFGGETNGGAGGESAATGGFTGEGERCDYNSQCADGLVCGPSGLCQYECLTDRDCASGSTCTSEFRCVAE